MFPILPNEQAAADFVTTLRKELAAAHNKRHTSWGTPVSRDEYEAQQTQIVDLDAQLTAAQNDPDFLVYMLKTELSKQVDKLLPGGNFDAILTFAEQAEMILDGDSAARVAALGKKLAIRVLSAMADEEINAARAKVTMARYTALVNVGFDPSAALQIVVAEASRPVNFGSPVSASRSK